MLQQTQTSIIQYLNRIIQKMLTHYYNQEQSQSSQLSQKILRLKSIKQDLNQDESYGYNLLAPTLTLTLRMKGMVLMGLLAKNKGTATKVLKKAILIWYTHSNHNRHVHAINKFVTGGNVRKQQIFYRLKIMANIQILYQGVITTKEKRQKGSKKGQKKRSQNQKKVLISADNSYLKNNKPLLDLQKKNGQINENYMVSLNVCDKQKNQQCKKSNKGNHFFASNNISINNILLESQTILKGNQGINNQNSRQFSQNKSKSNLDNQSNQSKSKQSISLIDPISGNLPMQLNTCANLFQNSSSRRNRATFRISGIIQLCRQTDKIKNKLLRHAFKKLIQNSMEQDYENQLLQVRRHLELVQENFMVQCQIEAILQNYEQQNQHLDKIDNHIQTLKQKFLFSTTASIVKALKKLIYPNLQVFYSQFQENNKSEKNYIIKAKSIKLYQVHELFDASSNSLSYKTYSNNLLKNAQNESNKEPSYTGFIANNSLKLCTESFPENDNYDNSHMGNEKE